MVRKFGCPLEYLGSFYKMSVFWLHPRPVTLESLWMGLGCW